MESKSLPIRIHFQCSVVAFDSNWPRSFPFGFARVRRAAKCLCDVGRKLNTDLICASHLLSRNSPIKRRDNKLRARMNQIEIEDQLVNLMVHQASARSTLQRIAANVRLRHGSLM